MNKDYAYWVSSFMRTEHGALNLLEPSMLYSPARPSLRQREMSSRSFVRQAQV